MCVCTTHISRPFNRFNESENRKAHIFHGLWTPSNWTHLCFSCSPLIDTSCCHTNVQISPTAAECHASFHLLMSPVFLFSCWTNCIKIRRKSSLTPESKHLRHAKKKKCRRCICYLQKHNKTQEKQTKRENQKHMTLNRRGKPVVWKNPIHL